MARFLRVDNVRFPVVPLPTSFEITGSRPLWGLTHHRAGRFSRWCALLTGQANTLPPW